jgi:hypothetical protein
VDFIKGKRDVDLIGGDAVDVSDEILQTWLKLMDRSKYTWPDFPCR